MCTELEKEALEAELRFSNLINLPFTILFNTLCVGTTMYITFFINIHELEICWGLLIIIVLFLFFLFAAIFLKRRSINKYQKLVQKRKDTLSSEEKQISSSEQLTNYDIEREILESKLEAEITSAAIPNIICNTIYSSVAIIVAALISPTDKNIIIIVIAIMVPALILSSIVMRIRRCKLKQYINSKKEKNIFIS